MINPIKMQPNNNVSSTKGPLVNDTITTNSHLNSHTQSLPLSNINTNTNSNTNNNNPTSAIENNSTALRPWQKEWENAFPIFEEYRNELRERPRPNLEILRVNQLDALKLDFEITEVLKSQFMRIFTFFKPELIDKYQPELLALLNILVYKLSIFNMGTTYGNILQNLRFRNERAVKDGPPNPDAFPLSTFQKIMYGIVLIGGEWAWNRINRLSVESGWSECAEDDYRRKAWVLLSRLETAFRLFSIINFLVFLYDGKYVTLVTRILGMRLVYARPSMTRRVSFEYMNRQLVWHGFTEFLLFLMPLVNIDRIKGLFKRRFSKPTSSSSSNNPNNEPLSAQAPQLIGISCPSCASEPPCIPYVASCNHIFCYYCLKASAMADNQFSCQRCGQTITSMKRYQPDLEPLNLNANTNNTQEGST
eukprot:TRINITY_DN736_c0_g2_i5.p1 TRINITY_DN736_c0_g2~~TRINITY_DN736_c0_g2_i5.p1  ORF type:complete len:420 (-),score=50.83 TRINITY_DN736_c0_g2_i5:23-1282(-)